MDISSIGGVFNSCHAGVFISSHAGVNTSTASCGVTTLLALLALYLGIFCNRGQEEDKAQMRPVFYLQPYYSSYVIGFSLFGGPANLPIVEVEVGFRPPFVFGS